MGTSSAMTIPPEDTPVIDLRIFDIFDAPSRLGESSKLLSRAASSSTCRPERPMPITTAATSRPVSPLPSPIVFDGPARPLHFDYGMLQTSRRTHSYAPLSPRSNLREHTTVTPLPNPIMFDGPSRLRPYVRGGSSRSDQSVSLFLVNVVAYDAQRFYGRLLTTTEFSEFITKNNAGCSRFGSRCASRL